MVFKFEILELDYRNNQGPIQKVTIDTFFQNNAIEGWSISDNETIVVTYDDAVATKPTRFDMIDFGDAGVKGDIPTANANAALDTIVSGNHIIHQQLVEDRILAIQYKEGTISVDTLAENQRVSDEDLQVVSPPVYAEIAATALQTQQTGIDDVTFVKINQIPTIIRQKNMTISGPNDNITIDVAGLFNIFGTISFSGSASDTFEVAVFVNDTKVDHITAVTKLDAGGDVGVIAFTGTEQLAINDVVDLRVLSDDSGGANFRVVRANFIINKVR